MGLSDGIGADGEAQSSGSSSSSSGSGSSGSSSGSYPKYKEKIPAVAIYKDEDGNYQYARRPQNLFIEYEKASSSSSWEISAIPEEVERYWLNPLDFKAICQKVENNLGEDLVELMKNNPERALTAIRKAVRQESPEDKKKEPIRKCAVCDEDIHLLKDDYREIENKVVHEHHTVEDLKHADLI